MKVDASRKREEVTLRRMRIMNQLRHRTDDFQSDEKDRVNTCQTVTVHSVIVLRERKVAHRADAVRLFCGTPASGIASAIRVSAILRHEQVPE